jgi:hypothetical protein
MGLCAFETEWSAPVPPRQIRTDGSSDPEGERMADPSRPPSSRFITRLGLNLERGKAPPEILPIESVKRQL